MQIYGGVFLNNYNQLNSRCNKSLLSYIPNQKKSSINQPVILSSFYSESSKKTLQDPLLELHSESSKYETKNIDSVIIYLNGYLYLLSGNNLVDKNTDNYLREETPARRRLYNMLKIMSHVSVNINIILLPYITMKIPYDSQISIKLNKLRDHIDSMKKPQNRNSIFDNTLKYIELFKDCKNIAELEKLLIKYNEISCSRNKTLRQLSARLQIKGINRIISKWESEGYLSLGNTKVIIAGSQGPRKNNLEKQCFDLKYGDNNVTYVEMLPKQLNNVTPNELLDRLLENEQNKVIGYYMFNNPDALSEDILGDDAREELEALIRRDCNLLKK